MKDRARLSLLWVSLCVLLYAGCSQEDTPLEPGEHPPPIEDAEIEAITRLQNDFGTALVTLFETMDTVEACDSIARSLLADTLVDTAFFDSSKILIHYSNGVLGAITSIDTTETLSPQKMQATQQTHALQANGLKACFVNAWRGMNTTTFATPLRNAGFDVEERQASLDVCADLNDYAVICFDGHGMSVSSSIHLNGVQYSLNEVFFATKQKVSTPLPSRFAPHVNDNILALVYVIDFQDSYYYVSSRFIQSYNSFTQPKVLFYGKFCGSSSLNSQWPRTLGTGEHAFVGFADKITTEISNPFMGNLFLALCNTMSQQPITIGEWNATEASTPIWGCARDGFVETCSWVEPLVSGNSSFTLWDQPAIHLDIDDGNGAADIDIHAFGTSAEFSGEWVYHTTANGEDLTVTCPFMGAAGTHISNTYSFQASGTATLTGSQGSNATSSFHLSLSINTAQNAGSYTITFGDSAWPGQSGTFSTN